MECMDVLTDMPACTLRTFWHVHTDMVFGEVAELAGK